MHQIFAKRLHELRKAKGKYYTQTKIAKQIGKLCGKQISQTTYTTWENGRSIPDIRTLAAIGDYFNVSLDYLFGKEISDSRKKRKSAVVMDSIEELLADKPLRDQEYYLSVLQNFIDETDKRDASKQKQYFKDQLSQYSDLINQLNFLTEVDDEVKGPIRMEILLKLADEWHKNNNFENAISCLNEAIQIHDEYGHGSGYIPGSLRTIGVIYCKMGQFTRGMEFFKKALRLTQDDELKAKILMNIGSVNYHLGEYEKSLDYFDRALKDYEKAHLDEYIVHYNKSRSYYFMGQLDKSIEYCEIALRKARRNEDRYHEALFLLGLGDCKRWLGFFDEAMEIFSESLDIFKELNAVYEQNMINQCMATLMNDMGDNAKAAELLEESIVVSGNLNDRRGEVDGITELGRAHRNLGDYDKAKQLHEKALDLSFELKSTFLEVEIRNNLGLDYLHLNKTGEAAEEALEALEKADNLADVFLQYSSYSILGKIFTKKREFDKAYQFYQKAVDGIKIIRDGIVDETVIQSYIKRKDVQEIYKETSKLLKKMGTSQ